MKPIIKRFTMTIVVINILMVIFSSNFTSSAANAAAVEPAAPQVSKAAEGDSAPGLANRKLSSVLNPDGTVKAGAGADGSYDASGYQMEMTASGTPRFVQSGCRPAHGHWDTQFKLPDGVLGYVSVLG